MGYSSGAHLVALVGTDERYLGKYGMKPDALEGVIAMDVDAYDIPRAILEADSLGHERAQTNLVRIFGASEDVQKDASPVYHVSPGRRYPPFLVISAGIKDARENAPQELSKAQSKYFVEKLLAASGRVKHIHFPDKTHMQIVTGFSRQDDEVGSEVFSFLEQ
jgi:acetyl esterase/lipase